MKLIFASNNLHKLEEARAILPEFEILSLGDIGLHADIPETSDTLEGNSQQKADYVYAWYKTHQAQLPSDVVGCFADDTGLCIRALNWQPGVYTARWAGEECNPADNRAKTLQLMAGIADRYAEFRTVITLIYWATPHSLLTPVNKQFVGLVEGHISTEERGEHGFGYDPVFVPENQTLTFAELPSEFKHSISHRGRAMRQLTDFFATI